VVVLTVSNNESSIVEAAYEIKLGHGQYHHAVAGGSLIIKNE